MKRTIFNSLIVLQLLLCSSFSGTEPIDIIKLAVVVLKVQVMKEASWAMQQQPITVTASSSPRSAGEIHDFFSEADYFWPDPKHLAGPYVETWTP